MMQQITKKTFVLRNNGTVVMSTSYTYNKLNLLETVANGTNVTSYTYDADGNLLTDTMGGHVTAYGYNDGNMLTSVSSTYGTKILQAHSYEYYPNGCVFTASHISDGRSWRDTYTYDSVGRIKTESASDNSVSKKYSYDSYNNIKTVEDYVSMATIANSYDKNNRLTKEIKTEDGRLQITAYHYDNNGNTISNVVDRFASGAGTASVDIWDINKSVCEVGLYKYNGFNQLVSAMENGVSATYAYDASGLRQSKTVNGVTTIHIWDGTDIVAEADGSGGVINKYYRGNGLIYADFGTTSVKYLKDAHGNVSGLATMTGALSKTYQYLAFGMEKSIDPGDANPFRYCGEYYDKETESYYLRARYYSPSIGRFISEDPIRAGHNWYSYCDSNPVKYMDPTGLDKDLDDYVNNNYSGKVTVTIAAQRPVENSRQAVDFDTGDVGHTFIRIDYGDGRVIYRGFYPSSPLSTEQILKKEDVTGKFVDDKNHDWNAAVVYEVSSEQADKVVKFIEGYGENYNMVSNNCTSFAVDALGAAGISSPTSEHEWTLPDNTRQMIIDNLPSDKWFKGATVDYLISGLKGYTPADAVQDFKSSSNYILKYGGRVEAGSNNNSNNRKW